VRKHGQLNAPYAMYPAIPLMQTRRNGRCADVDHEGSADREPQA
jgi:hypothetical protein